MQSSAATVAEYLAELSADRRAVLEAVRSVILKNLDGGYEEGMQYGMIGYFVPHRLYPPGYHCNPKEPLPFICLASQKNYMSLYLSCVYDCGDTRADWFTKAWARTGKKLDMGKSCIRFRTVDDLALDVIAEALRHFPVNKYVEFYESTLKEVDSARAERKARSAAPSSKPAGKKKIARPADAARKKTKRSR